MPGLFDGAGRTALVTGSSRGRVRATARGLAKTGAAVLLTGAAVFLPLRASDDADARASMSTAGCSP